MFENFDFHYRRTIYQSLLNSVRTNTGIGFHDHDQGHLAAYLHSSALKPGVDKSTGWPEYNELYIMMKELSDSLKDCEDFEANDLITCWTDFCLMAVEGYNKRR